MELRLWIGLHSCLQCFVLVLSDASYIIKYMTRFTEEGFSGLISFIFISDAIKKMVSGTWTTTTVNRQVSDLRLNIFIAKKTEYVLLLFWVVYINHSNGDDTVYFKS